MTDFRALCAELLQELEHASAWDYQQVLKDQARAALSQPEPEPVAPTDEEIMELMPQQMRDDLAYAARAMAGFDRATVAATGAMRIILNRHAVDHARAVLARWGRPAIEPEPEAHNG